jgi:hypothetical protein
MKLVRPVAKLSLNEALKEPRAPFGAVEIEIGCELLRLLVEDVEPAVEIVDEEAASAGLVPHVILARELRARVGVGGVRGHRQRGVVLQLERQARR